MASVDLPAAELLRQFYRDPWEWNPKLKCWHTRILPLPLQYMVPCLDFPDATSKAESPVDFIAKKLGRPVSKPGTRVKWGILAIVYRVKQIRENTKKQKPERRRRGMKSASSEYTKTPVEIETDQASRTTAVAATAGKPLFTKY